MKPFRSTLTRQQQAEYRLFTGCEAPEYLPDVMLMSPDELERYKRELTFLQTPSWSAEDEYLHQKFHRELDLKVPSLLWNWDKFFGWFATPLKYLITWVLAVVAAIIVGFGSLLLVTWITGVIVHWVFGFLFGGLGCLAYMLVFYTLEEKWIDRW